MKEEVILIDEHDRPRGTMEKMSAHLSGDLHRAFSVFVFNSDGELLLQQRAMSKYHSPGIWTNTCCSHPRPGELTIDAANRRLAEEMGMACELSYMFNFLYRAELDGGLVEHELDHVFFGISDTAPVPAADEVMDTLYINLQDLRTQLTNEPQRYSAWLKICFDKVEEMHREYFSIEENKR